MIINYIGRVVKYGEKNSFISANTHTKKGIMNVKVTKDSGLELKQGVNAFEVNKTDIFIGDKDTDYPSLIIKKGTPCEPSADYIAELEQRRECELAEYFDF